MSRIASRGIRAIAVVGLGVAAPFAYEGCSSGTAGDAPDAGQGADATTNDSASAAGDSASVDDAAAAAETSDDGSAPGDAATEASADAQSADAGPCADDAGNALPNELRCTGLYADWDSHTLGAGVRPYTPGYQLWSDGAIKSRFIYLPPGTTIDTTDMDEWVFPVGTKVWKEFKLGVQRIETRIFWKRDAATWLWTSYRWSADEKTATKLETGEQNVNGGTYEIPSHNQCSQCHGGRIDKLLGFDAISLGASGATGVTLATLSAQGWLSTNPPASLVIPEDSSGNARPALGWFHANCGSACHNANPAALAHGTGLFLRVSAKQIAQGGGSVRVEDLPSYQTSVNVVPNMSQFAQQNYFRISPGNVSKSLIPLLDGARNDPNGIPQMPPIISHQPDTTGLGLVTTWISTMPIPDGGAADAGITDAGGGG